MTSTPVELADPARGARAPGDPWPGIFLAIVGVASFVILALLVAVVWLSFRDGPPGDARAIWTVANYPTIFLDAFTYRVLLNTLGFAAVTVAVALAFGVAIGWLVERTDIPGKRGILALMAVGLLIPGFAAAMGWLFLLHPRIGLVNSWLQQHFGITAPFNIASIVGMGWVQGLSLAPLAFVMTAAVLRATDPALEESARMSGANAPRTLGRVTLPLAWPGVLAAAIYIFTLGFAAFDVPAIIGWSNRIYTISTYLLLQLSPTDALPRYGTAASLSVLLIAFAGLLSLFYRRMQGRAHRYQIVTGKAYRPRLAALGRGGKALAWLFVGGYLLLAKLLPLLVLVWASVLPYFQPPSAAAWRTASLARYFRLPWELIGEGLVNTGLLMLLTPTFTLLLALCFSWIVLRSRVPGRGWFDVIAFLPHAVPNIVFGVGALLLTLFALERVLPLYGTVWLLLLLFVIARLSYATRMTNSGLIQIHRELEECAAVNGASTGSVLRSIIVPLLSPTLLYAWLWIALMTFRELTLAVLLTTRDNITLPVVIWSLWLGGGLGDAAAVALLMLALMLPVVALYWIVAGKHGPRAVG